jgi:predicted CXXCH cytochrome family protein
LKPNTPWILATAIIIFVAFGAILWSGRPLSDSSKTADSTDPAPPKYAGSATCKDCHADAYNAWHQSQHAGAERLIDYAIDTPAFTGHPQIKHGSQTSTVRTEDGEFQVVTLGAANVVEPFPVERIIGIEPLRQCLIPAPGGRYQITELAYDPANKEWFDIYGNEDRQPHEWGHWSNRGMNWNSMCAACHNTGLSKNYNPADDTYDTAFAELGVGCEACHGPADAHLQWQQKHPNQKNDPTAPRLEADRVVATCGSCHARRSELTGKFVPGEKFLDHYRPEIPNETDVFYADGQVHGENYEYTSFTMSRMHQVGVRCINCHDPHAGKLRLPGNDMCMSCHKENPKTIDPGPHSHHDLAGAGGQCVNCHMPLTTYMQRDPRRDHGFTIPDPLLTQQFGIPNACNRCHTDKDVDWAVDAIQKWYGDRMNRPTRARAQLIARAKRADSTVIQPLLAMLKTEAIPTWRAVAAGLLGQWVDQPSVQASLQSRLTDADPLVRSTAISALDPLADQMAPRLSGLLTDPVRLVRTQAAWTLRSQIDLDTLAGRDLIANLMHNADQPGGALMLGQFHANRRQYDEAIQWHRQAVEWEPYAAPARHELAITYSAAGRPKDALVEAEKAAQLEPDVGIYQQSLGLARAEAGDLDGAIEALKKAVQVEPTFIRAWYNLGLALHGQKQSNEAIAALSRAADLAPNDPNYVFTLATVFRDVGNLPAAQAAAQHVLTLDPTHQGAHGLLRSLTQKP